MINKKYFFHSKNSFYLISIFIFNISFLFCQKSTHQSVKYKKIQKRLQKGWNTWNNNSVLQHVLLPQGFGINLSFKQQLKLDEKLLAQSFFEKTKDNQNKIVLGRHSLNGSYTELFIKIKKDNIKIESAHVGKDLVILIDPDLMEKNQTKLILETIILWNRKGSFDRQKTMLEAVLPGKIVKIFTTEQEALEDLYVNAKTPYLCFWLDKKIGISTGTKRSISQIESILRLEKNKMQARANTYDDLSEIYSAIESSLGWGLVLEPELNRVIITADRTYFDITEGQYFLNWNNFFLSYLSGFFSKEVAYASMIELFQNNVIGNKISNTNKINKTGFNIMPSIPIGSVLVKEIYKMHPNYWFLESCFEGLLVWNRWWPKNRINNGLLSYKKSDIINRSKNKNTDQGDNDMYLFSSYKKNKLNNKTGTFYLQDAGLTSLYIADCYSLLEIAKILNQDEVALELESRIKYFKREMEGLWDDQNGTYLNYDIKSKVFSKPDNMKIFFPFLAQLGDSEQKESILKIFNIENFNYNEYNELWPALYFLTYLSFRNAGLDNEAKELSSNSNKILSQGLYNEEYLITAPLNSSINSGPIRLMSKKHSFKTALLGITEFIERGFIPKPELLLK